MTDTTYATPEQRERATAYWENVVRPRIGISEEEPPTATPTEVLARVCSITVEEAGARLEALPDAA